MTDNIAPFEEGDRVTHEAFGMGTVRMDPVEESLEMTLQEEAMAGDNLVYVVWDNKTIRPCKVPAGEIEEVLP